MELKRIFLNRKTLLFIAILFVLNGLLFCMQVRNNADVVGFDWKKIKSLMPEMVESYNSGKLSKDDIESQLEKYSVISELANIDDVKARDTELYMMYYADTENELRSTYPEYAEMYEKSDFKTMMTYNYAYSRLYEQIEYKNSYSSMISDIEEKAKELLGTHIFSAINDQASKDINKSVSDYRKIKNVEISVGNDDVVLMISGHVILRYILILFSVYLIFKISEDKKKDIHLLVFSACKGRSRLALKQCGILFGSVFIFTFAAYAEITGLSLLTCGYEDLGRNIQSVNQFFDFHLLMNELEFIIYYAAITFISASAFAALFWALRVWLRDHTVFFLAVSIFVAAEYLLYNFISDQSVFAVARYINLFAYFDLEYFVTSYRNITIGQLCVSRSALMIGGFAVMFLLFAALAVVLNSVQRPVRTLNFVEIAIKRFFNMLTRVYHKMLSRLNAMGVEAYKLLVVRKGIIIAAVALLVAADMFPVLKYAYRGNDAFMHTFYNENGGAVTAGTYEKVKEMEDTLARVEKEYNEAEEKFSSGEISADDFEKAASKYGAYSVQRESLDIIHEKLEYAEKVAKNRSVNISLVDPKGYNYILGNENTDTMVTSAVLILICLTLTASSAFSFEKAHNADLLLKSLDKGRKSLAVKKIAVAELTALLIFLLYKAMIVNSYVKSFDVRYVLSPVQSIGENCNFDFRISILGYIALVFSAQALAVMLFTAFVVFLSAAMNYNFCCLTGLTVVIFPMIAEKCGLDLMEYLSLADIVSGMGHLSPIKLFVIIAAFAAGIILFWVGAARLWCKTRRC